LADLSFRPVKPSTLKQREWQIRAFASALVHQGLDAATLTSLANLVAVDIFKTGLRYFISRRDGKTTSSIADLAAALKAIARHHVGVDPDHLRELQRIARKLEPKRRGLTKTNRTRLRQLDDPGNALALLRLPERLMVLASRERRPYKAALFAQLAVAIEILL